MNKISDKYFLLKLGETNVFNKVVEQLIKDLYLSALDAESIDASEPEKCLLTLKELMIKSVRFDPETLRSFLYRVDVKEEAIIESFEQLSAEEFGEKVAVLILIRELQKVQSRLNYESV